MEGLRLPVVREDGRKSPPLLTAKSSPPQEMQIYNDIDPAGEFKVTLGQASQPTYAAGTRPSTQCQTPPPRMSLEDSKEHGIITGQQTPKPAIQDIKIGNEVLVVNTHQVPLLNIKPDQPEFLNQDHLGIGIDALYEDRFQKLGKPELDNAAARGLTVEAKLFKDPDHVPQSVSKGSVPTFAMHVDKTKTTLVPSLEKHQTFAGESAEVLASYLKQTPPSTQENLQTENGSSDSLSQGSSSSSLM